MEKRLLALVTLVAISMIASHASAQDWKSGWNASQHASVSAASSKIVGLSGSITGTVIASSGGCTEGFSNQCPSGHTCECFTVMGAKFSSSGIGNGSTNLFATIDQTAAFGSLGADCAPVYAEIDVIAKKDSPTFDVIGAACFNPQSNIVSNGAMGLATSLRFIDTGYATYTATINGSSGHLVLNFKGAAE